jgi:hypothetical protein
VALHTFNDLGREEIVLHDLDTVIEFTQGSSVVDHCREIFKDESPFDVGEFTADSAYLAPRPASDINEYDWRLFGIKFLNDFFFLGEPARPLYTFSTKVAFHEGVESLHYSW